MKTGTSLTDPSPHETTRPLGWRVGFLTAVCALAQLSPVATAQTTVIAYAVPAATAGNQPFGGALGMDFDVDNPILVTRLGVFDDSSDGLKLPITARLYSRANLTELVAIEFSPEEPGDLIGGSRFKALPEPLRLETGFQGTIVAEGYGTEERLRNAGEGVPPAGVSWTLNDGAGSLKFVGTGRYSLTAGVFPYALDGGPAARYAAGTFEFEILPPVRQPRAGYAYINPQGMVGNQEFAGSVGMDFDVDRDVEIEKLGVFDDHSDGLSLSLHVAIWDRISREEMANCEFRPEDPGELVSGSRFKTLPSPLRLRAGFQGTIVAYGYGAGERFFNTENRPEDVARLGLFDGACLRFVGQGRYGVAGQFPDTLDGGPANRYAAGTFYFYPYPPRPVALAEAIPNPAVVGQIVMFDGSDSYHQDPALTINSWAWDFNMDGINDASGRIVRHSFLQLGDYEVRLMVSDNGEHRQQASTLVVVKIDKPPLAPTAVAGGPYHLCPQAMPWYLDGRASVNPDEGKDGFAPPRKPDTIVEYAWDLDGDLDFNDAFGAVIDVTGFYQARGPGSYVAELRVTDNTSESFWASGWGNQSDCDTAVVHVFAATDPRCSCVVDLVAVAQGPSVLLTWSDFGTESYGVFLSEASGGPYQMIGTTSATTYLDSRAGCDRTRYYVVRPMAANGTELCQSNQASASPTCNQPPGISGFADATIPEDGTLGPLEFVVSDPETPLAELQVAVSSTDPVLLPSAAFTIGGATDGVRTLTVTPAANRFGSAPVQLVVTDSSGGQTSSTFTLTVTPVNDPPAQPQPVAPVAGATSQPLEVLLQGSPFADVDAGDRHTASRWQVVKDGSGAVVLDTTTTNHLTSLQVPQGTLVGGVRYAWQVSYRDSADTWSPASPAVAFTTELSLGIGVLPEAEVEIRWGGRGVLQSAPSVTGPWTDIRDAESPLIVRVGERMLFYRVFIP